jgi:glycerol uptake facilitator-like aquaporin
VPRGRSTRRGRTPHGPERTTERAAAAADQRRSWRVHFGEWGAEAAGTALLLIGGLSAVCLDFGKHSWVAAHVPSVSLRLLLTGLLFAGTGSLVAISPLGRLSGAHVNPVVTVAFRITGQVHAADLGGYIAAQVLGEPRARPSCGCSGTKQQRASATV